MSTSPRIKPGTIRLTYEDYLTLPEDGRRYEILDGDLAVTPAPTTRHQRVSANLEFVLQTHVRDQRRGVVLHAPVDVILADTTVVQPDIVFLAERRLSIMTERAIEGPPDLGVEILSESTAQRDRTAKAGLYSRYGIDHYWLVDPVDREFEIYRRRDRSYELIARHRGEVTIETETFPGLRIDLDEVWV